MRAVVWLSAGGLDLVEQSEHRLMLGGERVGPVAGRAGHALDDHLAPVIGGEADRGAGHGGGGEHAGLAAAEAERGFRAAVGAGVVA